MLHIQFRALRIGEDRERLNSQTLTDNRDQIKQMRNVAYGFIDTMVCMEHIVGVINDILSTSELRDKMDREILTVLNASKKAAEKWKPVRNRVGGHLCIDVFESFCTEHNYQGVFLSDDLEADLGLLNMLAIGSAINDARKTCDIFHRDINIMHMPDMRILVNQLNEDCTTALSYFDPVSRFMYDVGREEKLAAAHPDDTVGIVQGE
tara:strand:+ start:19978 stop:20598 length:621 start_codon:yes stop_codon:yes gene_type:complete